ncbi:MAG: sulfotransferase family 2 domain-containing protein [Hyphomicrobiales bacterium]|nr:sulfotransferase family 2 domain-containing protein [Hyphomicrobiales bacterium]
MIVCHEHKFIFLKTQKTAGTSIECALSAFCGPDDIITPVSSSDEHLRQGRGPQNWRLPHVPWYKTALRPLNFYKDRTNRARFWHHMPAERIRAEVGEQVWKSYFKFAVERNPWDRQISLYKYRKRKKRRADMTLEEFMREERIARLKNFHIYSIDGKVEADFVCQFDNLAEDVGKALAQVGIMQPLNLPRAKGQYRSGDQRPYRDFYTDETRAIVADWYAPEIRHFGYEF